MRFMKQFVDGNGQAVVKEPLFAKNPYLSSRRAWNSQVDRAFNSLHFMQVVVVASLLVSLALASGIIYMGSQNRFVPYVIEVNKLGDSVAVGAAQLAAPADFRVIRASLAEFIAKARMVTPDTELQRKAIFSVYGMMKSKDPATTKMTEYLNGDPKSTPFARAAKMTVDTEISTVLPITSKTWSVEWTENIRDREGGFMGKPVSMRSTLEIYIDPPPGDSKQADIQRNPLGIYVKDFNWQSL